MDSRLTSTVEQYLKAIYQLSLRTGNDRVEMGAIAEAMGVAPGTATSMVRHMERKQLVAYQLRKGATLTAHGRILGTRIVRRHRLIEVFLKQILEYDEREVHPDAEVLEHAVSDTFIERIDALMNHPTVDPHGSPIPSKSDIDAAESPYALSACAVGSVHQIARITSDNPQTTADLKKQLLTPGAQIKVIEHNPNLEIIVVKHIPTGAASHLGLHIAASVLVTRADTPHSVRTG